ncbi:MAG: VIT and VWA domain-containing protein [bacterium]|nr:VIT and VWA domain-containing protein [bacterium]
MNRAFITLLIVGLSLAGLFPLIAQADGLIIPVQPTEPAHLGDFYSVQFHRVQVVIKGQAVTTTVDQAFINETGRMIEVQYIFPLPRNSAVNQFSLIVDGKELQGKILDKAQARSIYESIVRRRRDPALLEYIDQGMFQTNVFPLPPKGLREVKLTYTELLPMQGNLIEYCYPLTTEKYSRNVLGEVRIDFDLTSDSPVKNVYSPTHDIRLDWEGSKHVKGHWSDENTRPETNFRLFWTLSEDRVGATLFTYRANTSEDGYFLLLASPRMDVLSEKAIPKNLLLVLDTSGSMEGEKIEQARGAAKYIAENLNPDDQFNLIFYSSMVDPLWDKLKPCSASNKSESLARIAQVKAEGSTDIHAALTTALKQVPDDNRPCYLIFLTDGLPTSGVIEAEKILSDAQSVNKRRTRIFAFGVGFDVNAVLLDQLGSENYGFADYVPPGENIEAKVSNLYSKIRNPVLTNPKLDFGGIRIRDSYPQNLPDIFYGSQLVLVGRYRDTGLKTVTLSGKSGEKSQSYAYYLDFASHTGAEDYAFVSRLWAQKKIGWLMAQIKLKGENKELVDEIVALSTRYGIMTPYTSFLADENVDLGDVVLNQQRSMAIADESVQILSGPQAVSKSMDLQGLSQSNLAAPQAQYHDQSGKKVREERVKIIGSKTFYLKQGQWVDSQYNNKMKLTELKQFSDELFKLAGRAVNQAQYLSFDNLRAIIVVLDGAAYKVVPVNN